MNEPERAFGPRLSLTFGQEGLANDLEWVLQSAQADEPLVAEALLHAFYRPIYSIARALNPQAEDLIPFIRPIFIAALNQRYRYRSSMDAVDWFYTAALKSLPAAVRREAWPPLAIVMQAYSGLPPAKIAALLEAPVKDVQLILYDLETAPARTLEENGWSVDEDFAKALENNWNEAFKERFAAPLLSEDELRLLAEDMAGHAERRGALHSRVLTLRELGLTGLAIVLVVGLFLTANRVFPAPAPETPAPVVFVATRMATPVIKTEPPRVVVVQPTLEATALPTPTPVSPLSLPQAISANQNPWRLRERMRTASLLWDTVWGEVQLTYANPAGYEGPPLAARVQFWVSDNQFRVVSGPLRGPAQHAVIGNGGKVLSMNADGSKQERFQYSRYKPPIQDQAAFPVIPINIPLNIPWIGVLSDLEPLANTIVADRPTVAVEQHDPSDELTARLWLDQGTALLLRAQLFQPGSSEPAFEMTSSQIELNIDFPNQSLFDVDHPPPVTYALDSSGFVYRVGPTTAPQPDPAILQTFADPLPEGFDPAQSALTFRYPEDLDLHEAEMNVDVLAGEYRLGTIRFGNPITLACARSPDGKRIAYSSLPVLTPSDRKALRWYDLDQIQRGIGNLIGGVSAEQIVFSPDSNRLAVMGESGQGKGISIITLEDNSVRIDFIMRSQTAHGLAWSPDGQYLAWVNVEDGGSASTLNVVNTIGTNAVYQGPYPATEPLPTSFPFPDWDPFQTGPTGLAACAAAP